ncbi:hypothetical protein JXQ31_05795 [candidate division KSB1 bacterium]|nr:hypothetical protein [candidate division KSB1 bacterium]
MTTIKDFKNLCDKQNINVKRQINPTQSRKGGLLVKLRPNYFANMAIFIIQNKN